MRKGALLAIAALALTVPFFVLAGQESPVVGSASNPTPRLEPGGPAVVIDLRGTSLDRIQSVRILSAGQEIKDVTVVLGPASPTTRSLTFKALAGAPARTALALQISDGRQSFDIPARIIQLEVGPVKPVNTLGPVDTTPRLIDATKTPAPAPNVTSFAINGGAASTTATRVVLNMSVQNASSYRASENSAFSGAVWKAWTITAVPPFDLSPGNGPKTVYVQVKNPAGQVSPAVNDSITLNVPPPPARVEYRIPAGEAHTFSTEQGFKTSQACNNPPIEEASWRDVNQGSGGSGPMMISLLVMGKPYITFGARCDFVLFDGRQLNEGWVFKSYDAVGPTDTYGHGYTVTERPTVGSRTIRFRIHLWCDAGNTCRFDITFITLEGPAGQDWREAFR
jgi:hypothetical protein